jgi:hypothetical protein
MKTLLCSLVIGLFLCGCAPERGGVRIDPNDSYWTALKEFFVITEQILEPLYPDPMTVKSFPSSETIAQYFMDNDFSNEVENLAALYQDAVQAHETAKDLRPDSVDLRLGGLELMERSLDIVLQTVEIAEKYKDTKMEFTKDERILLHDCVQLRQYGNPLP